MTSRDSIMTDTERLRSQYQWKLADARAEVTRAVNIATGFGEEHVSWLRRVDVAVDAIAETLGYDIPYQPKTEYADNHDVRYNPAYRLEMLALKIAEGTEE